MHAKPMQYKVFRKKLLVTAVAVALASALVFLTVMAFWLEDWTNEQRTDGEENFASIERRIGDEIARTGEYVLRLYSGRALSDDFDALVGARSEAHYIALRGRNSLRSSQMIQSFPADVQRFLSERGRSISSVVLDLDKETGGTDKLISLDAWGAAQLWFDAPGDAADVMRGDMLLCAYDIRDPKNSNGSLGSIQFWARSGALFSAGRAREGLHAIEVADGTLFYNGGSEAQRGWIREAAERPAPRGWMHTPEGWVYSTRHVSVQQYEYHYITVLDGARMLGRRAAVIWTLCGALVFFDALILGIVYSFMRYDATFLAYTMHIIECVEKGDFDAADKLDFPKSIRTNEYGIIASALANMKSALNHYILVQYRLKLKQQDTEMKMLQQQINPHFLYNTLEAVRAQALQEKSPQTAEAISLLGSLYRDIVRKDEVITLADEFALLEDYLAIMELRYPGSFVYQTEFAPELGEVRTVKLWLQPLAENFFSHGFDAGSEYNLIIATAYPEDGGVCVELVDNGRGIPPERLAAVNERMQSSVEESGGENVGLHNVYRRLLWFYGEGFSMEVRNNLEGGASVVAHIPQKEDAVCIPL